MLSTESPKSARIQVQDPDMDGLLQRAQENGLINQWSCVEKGYELSVTVGSFVLEPDVTRMFVLKLFEVRDEFAGHTSQQGRASQRQKV